MRLHPDLPKMDDSDVLMDLIGAQNASFIAIEGIYWSGKLCWNVKMTELMDRTEPGMGLNLYAKVRRSAKTTDPFLWKNIVKGRIRTRYSYFFEFEVEL